MALIVQAGDPVLRRPALPVPPEKLGTSELRAIVDEMVVTMREAPGVGLAAPQIGLPWQLIVVEDSAERLADLDPHARDARERSRLPLMAIVNPELRLVGSAQATFFEGCLSVAGYTALVARSLEVEVRGFTADGAPLLLQLRGWPARILQHEIDHLRGTLYVDRMLTRTLSRVEIAQRLWTDKPWEEIAAGLGVDPTQV